LIRSGPGEEQIDRFPPRLISTSGVPQRAAEPTSGSGGRDLLQHLGLDVEVRVHLVDVVVLVECVEQPQ
jgi:hypothetical protein